MFVPLPLCKCPLFPPTLSPIPPPFVLLSAIAFFCCTAFVLYHIPVLYHLTCSPLLERRIPRRWRWWWGCMGSEGPLTSWLDFSKGSLYSRRVAHFHSDLLYLASFFRNPPPHTHARIVHPPSLFHRRFSDVSYFNLEGGGVVEWRGSQISSPPAGISSLPLSFHPLSAAFCSSAFLH